MMKDALSALAEALQRQLPQASKGHLLRLAEMLTGPAVTPDKQTINGLLAEGCDPNSLHAAILFGRETAVAAICASDEQAASLNTTLSRYDRMVSLMMHQLVGQLQARLTSREHETLLSRAMVHWMREGEIELYNYFMEMPVKARVKIRDAHDQMLSVERNSALVSAIAAGEHGRSIMTSLPGSNLVLVLEVANAFGNKIHFRHAGIVPQVRERRRYPRVQPEPMLAVTVSIRGGDSLTAKALDYSEYGMGLVLEQWMPAKSGHVINIDWFTLGQDLKSPATVRWRQHAEGNTRFGIELTPDRHTHLELQQMVARAERHVLNRLRMKGVPDSLL